ncbi:GNAT family N-acetyltransferase [Chitinimonas koreensis]|uniref:GNAT family N-acetyltransferase n=1 Tax=Chitinimonas koreensis TaxID=356302 RepID=UPI000687B6B6|nr:GNAT family N-acetyltransferase [Chitinimonas koreensis]QNM98821.1 GNAT family N-acetyltransferase [Chitinimonas koreensis]
MTAPERQAVLSLSVTDEQIEFAGSVERSVERCNAEPDGQVAGLAIFECDAIVGFMLLKRATVEQAWANPSDALVTAMRIDLAHQGKGFGTAALRAVPGWIAQHWPDSRRLALSVDEENAAARRAYEKAGFIDSGVREMGRIGWVRYLAMPLEQLADAAAA